jgi:dihydroorotase
MESYAMVFEEEGVLDNLEAFASVNGARFYDLPINEKTATLERVETAIPETIDGLVPFHAGDTLRWRFSG